MAWLQVLISILFSSFIGWWILFVVALAVLAPVGLRLQSWARAKRFMAAQSAKLANPQNAEVRHELAQLYFDGGRAAKAERYAREAIEVARQNPLYDGVPYAFLRLLGHVCYRRRRYDEAAATFDLALKAPSQTGYHEALLGLAKAHYRCGRLEPALEFSRHAVEENTSALEGYFRWAQAAAALERADEVRQAREGFQRTRAALPPFARQRKLWFTLAFLLFPISRRIG